MITRNPSKQMQYAEATSKRIGACQPHERKWQGVCVDKNLHDEWLEALNRLECFELINICEGHADALQQKKRKRWAYSKIYVKLIEPYRSKYFGITDRKPKSFTALLNTMKWTSIPATRCGFEVIDNDDSKDVLIQLERKTPRVSVDMDNETVIWFENGMQLIRELDTFFSGESFLSY